MAKGLRIGFRHGKGSFADGCALWCMIRRSIATRQLRIGMHFACING